MKAVALFLAISCLKMIVLGAAQPDMVRILATRPAVNIQELQIQAPEMFEEEARVLEANPTGPAAVTLGDSITLFGYSPEGWITALQHDYPNVTFVNKGVGMANTNTGVFVSKWTVTDPKSPLYKQMDRIKLVTICFGANDASTRPRNATWRKVPEAEYKINLVKSINTFRAAKVTNILLLTPPPAAAPPRIDRRLEVTEGYANIVKEVGKEMHVAVVDIFNAIQQVPSWKETAMVKDGLHLAPAGQDVVHAAVRAAVRGKFS